MNIRMYICQICNGNIVVIGRGPGNKTMCDSCRLEYSNMQQEAYSALHKAVKCGKLQKGGRCQACGKKEYEKTIKGPKLNIVGHHYNGYNNPLDVMWLCKQCNMRISGPKYHSGRYSIDETIAILTQ